MEIKRCVILIVALSFFACSNSNQKKEKKVVAEQSAKVEDKLQVENQSTNDTIYHYWQVDKKVYMLDTVLMNTHIIINTYCLNDSSVLSTSFEKEENGKKIIEYYVAHNYESKVRINHGQRENEIVINMKTFKDSLTDDFMKIAHLWSNRYEKVEDNRILLRAKVAKPDTDYQYDFIYYIDTDGSVKIKKVEYGM